MGPMGSRVAVLGTGPNPLLAAAPGAGHKMQNARRVPSSVLLPPTVFFARVCVLGAFAFSLLAPESGYYGRFAWSGLCCAVPSLNFSPSRLLAVSPDAGHAAGRILSTPCPLCPRVISALEPTFLGHGKEPFRKEGLGRSWGAS